MEISLVEYNVRDLLIELINDAGLFIINYAQSKLSETQQEQLEEYVVETSGFE